MSTDDDPPPFFLSNELHGLTFQIVEGGTVYTADDTGMAAMFAWSQIVEQMADVKGDIRWESLDERAHFLNKLYVFCQRNHLKFPLSIDTNVFPHLQEKI